MSDIDIIDLYMILNDKFKSSLSNEKCDKVMIKIEKIVGLFYGSITGLLIGAATQPLGPGSASCAFRDKIPFCNIDKKNALADPVLGQFLSHMTELKNSKWDANKYKSLSLYKNVMLNTPMIKIDLAPQLIDQMRTRKAPELYNLFSEDFYIRVPICALFGDAAIDVAINKIMETHTSYEASAYGIITTGIIRLMLLNDNIFSDNLYENIKTALLNLLNSYHNIYVSNFVGIDEKMSESEKLRLHNMKTRIGDKYNEITNSIKSILEEDQIITTENTDHLVEEKEKKEYEITSLFKKSLDSLELENKNNSHPAMLSIWVIKALYTIHKKHDIYKLDIMEIIKAIIKAVATKTGNSAYNCMIVGCVLGIVFGCTHIPEEYYRLYNIKLMDYINREIISIISAM